MTKADCGVFDIKQIEVLNDPSVRATRALVIRQSAGVAFMIRFHGAWFGPLGPFPQSWTDGDGAIEVVGAITRYLIWACDCGHVERESGDEAE